MGTLSSVTVPAILVVAVVAHTLSIVLLVLVRALHNLHGLSLLVVGVLLGLILSTLNKFTAHLSVVD